MEILFAILRFLIGPNCFQSDQVEPVVVLPNGRTASVRELSTGERRFWHAMCWLTLRHTFHDPAASDVVAQRDLWCVVRSPNRSARAEHLRV